MSILPSLVLSAIGAVRKTRVSDPFLLPRDGGKAMVLSTAVLVLQPGDSVFVVGWSFPPPTGQAECRWRIWAEGDVHVNQAARDVETGHLLPTLGGHGHRKSWE